MAASLVTNFCKMWPPCPSCSCLGQPACICKLIQPTQLQIIGLACFVYISRLAFHSVAWILGIMSSLINICIVLNSSVNNLYTTHIEMLEKSIYFDRNKLNANICRVCAPLKTGIFSIVTRVPHCT